MPAGIRIEQPSAPVDADWTPSPDRVLLEKELDDCRIEDKAVIQSIILEVSDYIQTLERRLDFPTEYQYPGIVLLYLTV